MGPTRGLGASRGAARRSAPFTAGVALGAALIAGGLLPASTHAASGEPGSHRISFSERNLDFSGQTRLGIASFYAARFGGRTMADGTPMRLSGDNAASLTLPLGTVARVINLATGRSAVITIRDRGPYVQGRLVDLSPGTARRIGLDKRTGLAPVAVEPLAIPQRDERAKPVSPVGEMRYASVR
jgi:rare lipoprotein A